MASSVDTYPGLFVCLLFLGIFMFVCLMNLFGVFPGIVLFYRCENLSF